MLRFLPWWAVFGTLRHAGVPAATVDCFEAFYSSVRRRFRYGSIDGSPWHATNGLAQGCPASPDLLNILFEAFHRWAASTGCGPTVAGIPVASLSFADDLVLAGRSSADISHLIGAYLRWCSLLSVRVTKVQLWTSRGAGHSISVGSSTFCSIPSFRFVGVELGLPEPAASRAHFGPRVSKAVAAANRLRSLPLPAAVCCTLWRTAVLPQAVYGCHIRHVLPADLVPLASAGKSLFHKPPLELNLWRSPDVAMGLPLGASAIREPIAEVRLQQLRWLQLIANSPGLVGTLHRAVACPASEWREPSAALRAALSAMSWSVRRNPASALSAPWPALLPESSYPGAVCLPTADCFPLPHAAFTDGSLGTRGGAAVWIPDSEESLLLSVPSPRSSTHCELAALGLAMSAHPSEVYTDSLCSLQLLRSWGSRSTASVLRCADRFDVRHVLAASYNCPAPPSLRKVKAHDERAVADGHPLAIANDRVDGLAKLAARSPGLPTWDPPAACRDAVELLDAAGSPVLDIESFLPLAWWTRQRRAWGPPGSRPRLELIFPADIAIDWPSSTAIFARPCLRSALFHHPVAPAVIKWVARVRCGCLATQARRLRCGFADCSTCPCCAAVEEDDRHLLAGCPATGSADWPASLPELWLSAAQSCRIIAPPPPAEWIAQHHLPLTAALIPQAVLWHHPLPAADALRFLRRLHVALAERLAELLSRRYTLVWAAEAPTASSTSPTSAPPRLRRPCPLPPERQLSVPALRQLEVARRSAPPPAPLPPTVPPHGEARRLWLRDRLLRLLDDDMVVCPAAAGCSASAILAHFESTTLEHFTVSPGTPVKDRASAIARVLGNLLVESAALHPPLARMRRQGVWYYNRAPRVAMDVDTWRRSSHTAEGAHPAAALHQRMTSVDSTLASWIRSHRFLRPVPPDRGECSMALLLLWEVDHDQSFPTTAGADPSKLLSGFTRRLHDRVRREPDLAWFTFKDVHLPLARGLPPSHHVRWTVQIVEPPTSPPAPWYAAFVARWQAYLRSLVDPALAVAPAQSAPASLAATVQPAVRRAPPRPTPRPRLPQTTRIKKGSVSGTPAATPPALPPAQPVTTPAPRPATPPAAPPAPIVPPPRRPPSPPAEPRPVKRQLTLAAWRQPPRARSPPHGRATEGPPT